MKDELFCDAISSSQPPLQLFRMVTHHNVVFNVSA